FPCRPGASGDLRWFSDASSAARRLERGPSALAGDTVSTFAANLRDRQHVSAIGTKRARPSWRALAFLSSLLTPGSGHLLRGNHRRGLVWATAVTGLGMVLLLAVPISFPTLLILISVLALATLACAVDTLRLTDIRPPWKTALASWATLLVLSGLLG